MARFGDFDQYLDNAGDPLAEGKLYFYESGTTTPKTTYADINNSIPNTNPVLLSAAGRQPNIFFNGVAKVILTDNDDVQIAVRDPAGETGTDFGDEWVATKIYNAVDVVLGSDGIYYRSLINGNQNNNPVTTTGSWTLLYSVEWNQGITYSVGDVVTYGSQQYQSLQDSNLNQNPASQTAYWVPLNFAWLATATYAEDQNAVGTDGILYTSLQNANTGNDPATSPAYWVGTSAAAAASAVAAAASAAASASSATDSANSATASANSATASANSATASASSATDSANSATASASSATDSANSATASAASASAAATSETNAATSETNAATSASNSATSATASAASATAALASETAAAASETAAAASESAAATSATNSATSATQSANSATASASSATDSANSATASASSATASAGSATAAAGSATAAAGSATAAAGSATAASDKYDEFDARYLGEKASDPSVDNQGGALVEGALYFNTTSDAMKVYDGAAWVNVAPVATSITVSQISDYTGTATTLNYTSNLSSDAQTQLNAKVDTLGDLGVTATATELNYTDGVTSPIQTQLDAKAVYPSQTGNEGSFLTTDGTNPSWAEISASPTLQATASGTLANGNLVSINEDGTVSIVESSPPNVFDSFITLTAAVFDSNSNKVIIAFVEGQDGQAIVGTVSGTSISFGTQVEWEAARALELSMVFDSNSNKVVIAYKNTSFYGAAIVGTVSGTDISFGTPVLFEAADVAWIAATFDSNSNKVVISYMDDANSDYGTSIVGTVSGTSISFGTPVVFRSAITRYIYSTFDSNSNKVIVSYGNNSLRGEVVIGTVSGTSISFGTAVSFADAYIHLVPTFDSNSNKVVFAYPTYFDGVRKAVVGTVSGTSISFGTSQIYDAVGFSLSKPSITFNSNTNEIVIAYINSDLSGSVVTGTVSGTDVSFNAPSVFSSSATLNISPTFDSSNNKIVIAYMDDDNSDSGTAIVLNDFSKIQNYDSYIGISDGAYADGATANIQIVGSVDDAQSGLTVGKYYYVQQDGSLATTPDSISVFAGTSVAETKLIVKG